MLCKGEPSRSKKPGVGSNRNPHRLSTEPDDMCVRFGMPCVARVSLHGALTAQCASAPC